MAKIENEENKPIRKELLVRHGVINDVFNYQDLVFDEDILQTYSYFENSFINLYGSYANTYNIRDYCFYISNEDRCNAFATKRKGYNIIGITSGYPIHMNKKMNEEHFKNIALAGIGNNQPISEAYADIYTDKNFDISKFFLDCSIQFTFRHELQHIIQFNYFKSLNNSQFLHENMEEIKFDLRRHVWEYDADRMACFVVLKHVFSAYKKFEEKSTEKLKCLMYIGCSSIFITKILHFFGIMNQFNSPTSVTKLEFYIKEKSHPHPLVRCMNIIETFIVNITDDFPSLKMDPQEFLNNIFVITHLYFKSIVPTQDLIKDVFEELENHLDTINNYNIELYDCAIQDDAVRNHLQSQNIKFDDIQI